MLYCNKSRGYGDAALKIEDINLPQGLMGTRIKDRLEDAFDVNFDVSEIKIDTFDDFGRVLLEPYNGGEKALLPRRENKEPHEKAHTNSSEK